MAAPGTGRRPIHPVAILLTLALLATAAGPVRAQVADLSGRPGGLAGRIDQAVRDAAAGGPGDRFQVVVGFTGFISSDAEATGGGSIVIHRIDGWMTSGISGLPPVRDAWDEPGAGEEVLDLATMRLAAPPPAPVLEERRLLCFFTGRVGSDGTAALTGLLMRLPSGSVRLRERPVYWCGDVPAADLLAWTRSRLAALDPERDGELRSDLVGLASLFPDRAVVDLLAQLAADDPDPDVRQRAIAYLGRRPEDTTGRLEQIFDRAGDPEDRDQALSALAERQGPAVKPRLVRAARDGAEAEAVRARAITYLSRIEGRDVDDVLERLLTDPEPDLRRRVVTAWERRGPERSVPLLERVALTDEEGAVREAAVAGLGDIDSPLAADALRRLFTASGDERVRRRVLRERLETMTVTGERVAFLAEVARTDASLAVRRDAVQQLGRIDDPAARRVLREILDIGRL